MAIPCNRYQYRLDAKDRLIYVDPSWLAYARENGAEFLTEETVIGRPLWDFVSGDLLTAVYASIHQRVRDTGEPAVFPYRCDSPTMRRYMRMTISRESAGELLYDSIVEKAVPQRRLGILEAKRLRTQAVMEICSCCKRAHLESVGWLDLEDVSFRTGLLEAPAVPQLYHGLCPKCADMMRNSVNNSDVA